MEQAIMRGDTLFYIDPKNDEFAPHVMYQAAKAKGRKLYYLTLLMMMGSGNGLRSPVVQCVMVWPDQKSRMA